MCCLKYEQNAYEDLIRTTPRVGSVVNTPDGKGTVVEIVNILTGNLKIKIENGDNATVKSYSKHEITLSRDDMHRQPKEVKVSEPVIDEEILALEDEPSAKPRHRKPHRHKPSKNSETRQPADIQSDNQ